MLVDVVTWRWVKGCWCQCQHSDASMLVVVAVGCYGGGRCGAGRSRTVYSVNMLV